MKKVIAIGLDGLEPKIVDGLLAGGELPNLRNLTRQGGYSRVQTTFPAQTPVAWSTFATGANPGRHGIFDFIRRDPATYLPDSALNHYRRQSAYLPPKAVNLRRGTTLWEILSAAGLPSTIIRFPCTYPPDNIRGRMLAGMGVPDIRGGWGTSTFYTSGQDAEPRESEMVLTVQPDPSGLIRSHVIGLDSAAPEILFADERLSNFRRLMEAGCYGELETIIPPITVPAWMCMATSQDPGSLGVYGFRNRTDHSYKELGIVNSRAFRELTIWDQVAREGKRATIIGVPPSFPPRKVNGVCVGCFMTPDTKTDDYTEPPHLKEEIAGLVGEYAVDVRGFRTERKDWLKDEIYDMSRKHFEVVRHMMRKTAWDYFQFVEIGLDRLQHGFWKFHDPRHVLHQPGSPYADVIRDYYLYLDDEIGSVLDLLTEDTAVLVLSDHGAQRLDGGFCVNEWLVREGLLVLNEYPKETTPFSKLSVNWGKTRVWGEGGYYARVFFNVKGREPDGVLDVNDYEKFRDEIKYKLETTRCSATSPRDK